MKNLLLLLAFLPFMATAQDDAPATEEGKKEKKPKKEKTEKVEETSAESEPAKEEKVKEDNTLSLQEGVPTTYTKDVVGVPVKLKFGILAQLNPGFTFGMQSNLEKDLDSTFNADYSNNPLGMLIGGNIDFIIGSRLMIGGGGMMLNYNRRIALAPKGEVEPEIGMAHTSWTFAGARLGVILIHKARYKWNADVAKYEYSNSFLFYPFAAYHFMGNGKLTVDNYSSDIITFGGVPIEPIIQREFKATQGLIEVGLGTKWTKNPKGGLTFGLELGGYFGMGGTKWEFEGTELDMTKAANLTGGYLRVSVGGGYFKLK